MAAKSQDGHVERIAQLVLDSVERSARSESDISIAATGHPRAIGNLRRCKDLRLTTLVKLCRELGLEIRVGLLGERLPEVGRHDLRQIQSILDRMQEYGR